MCISFSTYMDRNGNKRVYPTLFCAIHSSLFEIMNTENVHATETNKIKNKIKLMIVANFSVQVSALRNVSKALKKIDEHL